MVALLTTVFVALAALVVDHGLAADTELRAKNAADASALAAAVVLSRGGTPADADSSARNYALADFGVSAADWSSCTTTLPPGYSPIAGSPCISQNAATRHVRVTLPSRTFPTIFAGIAGFSTQVVSGSAVAAWGPPDPSRCAVCVLDSVDSNTGSITADGDFYADNMTFNNAVGTVTANGGTVYYAGTLTKGTYVPSPPVQVTPAFQDPYTAVAAPVINTTKVALAPAGGACQPANYYADVSGCTSFDPGVYLVGGGTQSLNVTAAGVMFYLTCSSGDAKKGPPVTLHPCAAGGEAGANFGGAGNDNTVLTGLADATSPWNGFAVFVDRHNTRQQTWVGNGTLAVTGIMYSVNPGGVSDAGNGFNTVTGQMVVDNLHLDGTGKRKSHIYVKGTAGGAGGAASGVPRLSQ